MSQIHICFAADQKFGKYLYFAIASALISRAPDDILHFHILCNKVEQQDKDRLQRLAKQYDLSGSLEFIEFDYSRFSGLTSSNPRLPPAVYARFLLPEIFINLDKILYLDCDIIINDSLAELWKTDLQGNPIAAVLDCPEGEMAEYILELNLNPDHYVNAGILILDCAAWRRDNLVIKALESGKNRKLQFQDQDQLNIVFKDQITILDRTWNSLSTKVRRPDHKIIHYIGYKPWETVFVPDSDLFWDVALQLPDTRNLIPEVEEEINNFNFFRWHILVFKYHLLKCIGYRRKHYTQKLARYYKARETLNRLKLYFKQHEQV